MLKQILEKEHLIDYLLTLLMYKDIDCKQATKIHIFDDLDEILYIDEFLVNQYTSEDYLYSAELFNQLSENIVKIYNSDKLTVKLDN